MNNSLLAALGLGLALTFGFNASTAAAQSAAAIKVTLPHETIVGRSTLPAGDYLIRSLRSDSHTNILEFTSTNRGLSVVAMAIQISTPDRLPSAKSEVVMRSEGDKYAADKIFFEGYDTGYELLPLIHN